MASNSATTKEGVTERNTTEYKPDTTKTRPYKLH